MNGYRNESGTAFTLIELLVVIAIIAILAGLLLASMQGVKNRGRTVECASNLRQVFLAFQSYLQDHDGRLMQRFHPEKESGYDELLIDYIDKGATTDTSPVARKLFTCRAQEEISYPFEPGYGMNWYYDNTKVTLIDQATQLVLLAETLGRGPGSHRADGRNIDGDIGKLDDSRHEGRANYLFFDGHVSLMPYAETLAPQNLWGTDYGDHDQPAPE